jgi:hypothetical protein
MATWKPSTVEDIRAWFNGTYVVNPTDEEYWQALKQRIKDQSPVVKKPES